ncbi:MAG TPA: response regulator transcription factor [Ktedonobacteraceae bacterium]
MRHILAVEDESDVGDVLFQGLSQEGFNVMIARSGYEALDIVLNNEPDLVLLDVGLPDIDGFEVCRCLRAGENKPLPILMLSAFSTLGDKVRGLNCGADDYITKPFEFEELLARIQSALRQVERVTQKAQIIHIGDLVLDVTGRQVWRAGEPLELSKREFDLLEFLARNAGQVLTKSCIFEHIWGWDSEANWEVVKVYIRYLRKKLNLGDKPDLIHAIRGIGYVLRP